MATKPNTVRVKRTSTRNRVPSDRPRKHKHPADHWHQELHKALTDYPDKTKVYVTREYLEAAIAYHDETKASRLLLEENLQAEKDRHGRLTTSYTELTGDHETLLNSYGQLKNKLVSMEAQTTRLLRMIMGLVEELSLCACRCGKCPQ